MAAKKSKYLKRKQRRQQLEQLKKRKIEFFTIAEEKWEQWCDRYDSERIGDAEIIRYVNYPHSISTKCEWGFSAAPAFASVRD